MNAQTTYTAYELARLADCMSPDSPTSAGAVFLLRLVDDLAEILEADDRTDAVHEAADSAVPIYTHEVWSTFVDLGAYQEDPTELGADASDMEQAAKVALYMIAERCLFALLEETDETGGEE